MAKESTSIGPQAASERASEQSFEASLSRLTSIVETIERGDLPLEESLKLFEEGVRLSRAAHDKLHSAEKKIEELLSVDDKGNARTQPLT